MHVGIICLTRAETAEQAIKNVDYFLENDQEKHFFDYYNIGGGFSSDFSENHAEPLSACKKIVEGWHTDPYELSEHYWNKMLLADKERKKGNYDDRARLAESFLKLKNDRFFELSTVYNIDLETNDIEEALKEVNEYYAVMVDFHY